MKLEECTELLHVMEWLWATERTPLDHGAAIHRAAEIGARMGLEAAAATVQTQTTNWLSHGQRAVANILALSPADVVKGGVK